MKFLKSVRQIKNTGLIIKIKYFICLLIFFFIFSVHSVSSAELAYQIKAVMLGRIPSFVKWPWENKDKKTALDTPFQICVMGENPFGSLLDELYSDRKIKKRRVEIRHINLIADIKGCHLLFISASKKREVSNIVAFTRDKPILTLGETKGYTEKGVVLKFYSIHQKVRFEINQQAAQESGLVISSQLLSMAKIINPVKK